MKKVYLIHGWGGSSKGGWFDWLKNELKKNNIEVYSFDMPDTNHPKIEGWVGYLKKNVKNIDEETYFVGHSIGCQTILRFLESLDENFKIGGCAFVAGWFNLRGDLAEDEEDVEIARPWIETPIDTEKVKKTTTNFLALFSDDDPFVPVSEIDIFKKRLGSKTILKKNKEHFNEESEIKEVLEFILK